jgi:hypothetical protein
MSSLGEPTPPSPAPTPPTEVPPEVSQTAQQRGFGALIDARLMNRPVTTALIYLGAGVACLVLLLVSSWLIGTVFHPTSFSFAWSILRIVPLLFCFGMVLAPVYALRILIVGARSYFAYANGFVYRHNRRIQAVAWPEVRELRSVIATRGDAAGKLSHYDLVPLSGSAIPIPINIVNGRDEFLDNVIAALRHYGRPIN